MVFESLLSPKSAEKYPWMTFFLGFFCCTIAIFLGHFIFPNHSSLAIVALSTLFFVPLFYLTMIYEEEKDTQPNQTEKKLIFEHSKAFKFFIFLFLGMTLAFMFWFIIFSFFPFLGINNDIIFSVQAETIQAINAKVTADQANLMLQYGTNIFLNNIRVMIFCILFSFIYGAGSIFIITWNSSVIGLALGNYAISIINSATGNTAGAIILGTTCAFTRYMIHGIPEILAYFIAGLGGGIISVALVKQNYGTEEFESIVMDSAILILIAIAILFISAIIEVVITPMVMCRI
ncbi:MAG: stage II sporulation protein M [Candidatus Woesearchaeota archaeon]